MLRVEQVEDLRPQGRQGDVLGRDRADSGTYPGATGANGDAGRTDGDAELPGFRAAADDGERHGPAPYACAGCQSSGITAMTSISISHWGWPRADTTRPVEMGKTPFSHLPTTW
ncbi:hypothetical protein D9M73_220010 [compost metagenome]